MGIVDKVEERLGLQPEKLRATREGMKEYDNMCSSSVTFVMEEMRRRSAAKGRSTAGRGWSGDCSLGLRQDSPWRVCSSIVENKHF